MKPWIARPTLILILAALIAGCGGAAEEGGTAPDYKVLDSAPLGDEYIEVYNTYVLVDKASPETMRAVIKAEGAGDAHLFTFCEKRAYCFEAGKENGFGYVTSNVDGMRWITQNYDLSAKTKPGEIWTTKRIAPSHSGEGG